VTEGEQSVSRAGSLALSIVIPVYNGARLPLPLGISESAYKSLVIFASR
jgi:hypothetical protein